MPESAGIQGSTELDHAQIYKLLVSELTDFAVFLTDAEGRIVTWNPGVERILLYAEGEWIGKHLKMIFTPEDRAAQTHQLEMAKAVREGRAPGVRWHLRKDGSRVFVSVTLAALKDGDGRLVGFSKVMRDINENKEAEEARIKSDERLTLALDAGGSLGTWDLDLSTNRVYTDPRFARFFSVEPECAAAGVPLQDFLDGIHPEDRERVSESIRECLGSASDFASEYRLLQKDGSSRWVYTRGRCHTDESGKPVRFPAVSFDISERKQAELELAEKARLAALGADVGAALTQAADLSDALNRCAWAMVEHLDAAFARIWTLTPAGDVLELDASAGIYTHLDGPHGRVPVGAFKIGRIAQERLPHLTNDVANDPSISDPEWARREGMIAFAGYPLIVEDGLVGVLGLFARRRLEQDTLHALASVAASIAVGIKRKRTEAALRESEERFRTTFARAPIGMVITTVGGLLIETNQAYRDLTGYGPDELANTIFLDLTHPEEMAYNRQLYDQLLNGEVPSYTIEKRYLCHGGRYTWVRATATLLRDREGNPREIIGLVEDISERKRSEEERERLLGELARSNDELSRFAHVAAHDLRSPLRTIRSYTQLLERRLGSELDESTRVFMGLVLDGADRMGQLIDALLHYAQVGQDAPERQPVEMDTVFAGAVKNLGMLIEESHAKVRHGELPTIPGDRVQLVQLLQNLIANAIKYRRPDAPPRIQLSARTLNEGWAFEVEDNGQGIPARYREEIFEPLKRLHGNEVPGTGMGLAVCKKIVERHGGRIWVESEVGRGSTFHFTLGA